MLGGVRSSAGVLHQAYHSESMLSDAAAAACSSHPPHPYATRSSRNAPSPIEVPAAPRKKPPASPPVHLQVNLIASLAPPLVSRLPTPRRCKRIGSSSPPRHWVCRAFGSSLLPLSRRGCAVHFESKAAQRSPASLPLSVLLTRRCVWIPGRRAGRCHGIRVQVPRAAGGSGTHASHVAAVLHRHGDHAHRHARHGATSACSRRSARFYEF
jgi:hypothetical protein